VFVMQVVKPAQGVSWLAADCTALKQLYQYGGYPKKASAGFSTDRIGLSLAT
jgi:hypothetical protein